MVLVRIRPRPRMFAGPVHPVMRLMTYRQPPAERQVQTLRHSTRTLALVFWYDVGPVT